MDVYFAHIILFLDIYCDGSGPHGEYNASWSVAVFSSDVHRQQEHLIGYFCGPVILASMIGQFLGAQDETNQTAELSAIIWICLWILSIDHTQQDITIWSDSAWSIGIAQDYNTSNVHPIMMHVVQTLLYIVNQLKRVFIKHVKAHNDEPHNEFVDGLCSAYQKNLVPYPSDVTASWFGWPQQLPIHPYLLPKNIHYLTRLPIFFNTGTIPSEYPKVDHSTGCIHNFQGKFVPAMYLPSEVLAHAFDKDTSNKYQSYE